MPIKKDVTIGDCRLILGDAMEIFDGLKYDSIVSDPPYGQEFVSNHRIVKHKAIANDDDVKHLQWAYGCVGIICATYRSRKAS